MLGLKHVAILVCVILVVAHVCRADYDEYLEAMIRRNQLAHHQLLGDKDQDPWHKSLDALQLQHGVQDGMDSEGRFPDAYWSDFVNKLYAEDNQQTREPSAEEAAEKEAEEDDEQTTAENRVAHELHQPNHLTGPHVIQGGNNRLHHHKSTSKLPEYCSPPNPCPLSGDAGSLASRCDSDVEDTAEFNKAYIWRMMTSGACACDTEHMDRCPPHVKSVKAAKVPATRLQQEEVMLRRSSAYYLQGEHRETVAKKDFRKRGNPWLEGETAEKLENVEKKNGRRVWT